MSWDRNQNNAQLWDAINKLKKRVSTLERVACSIPQLRPGSMDEIDPTFAFHTPQELWDAQMKEAQLEIDPRPYEKSFEDLCRAAVFGPPVVIKQKPLF